MINLICRREMTDARTGLTLSPGEGTLLVVGTQDEFNEDCRLIDQDSRVSAREVR